ncbi:Na+-dependent transporter, partial [Myxococcota bacterium]|nr:Na+-dependent transporter [Myxococcota bacterium]
MPIERLAEALHRRLLALLIGVYALASIAPAPGLWMRSAETNLLGDFGLDHVSLTSALLSLLLF